MSATKRFNYSHLLTLIAVVLFVACPAAAQSVRLQGGVSETVFLSVTPNSPSENIGMSTVSNGNSVRITLSNPGAQSTVLRVPLIVRSNSGFRISAEFESETALLTQLSVIDVRATGALVSPLAVSQLEVPQPFDLRGLEESASSLLNALSLDMNQPLLVFNGPRVSLGGTLDSPGNALQVTLLIRLQSQSTGNGFVNLTFVGTATNKL